MELRIQGVPASVIVVMGVSKVIIRDANIASMIDLSASPNDLGEDPTMAFAKSKMSTEISVTPPRESDSLHGPKTRLAAATVGYRNLRDESSVE
ncbi:hypothetical protein FRB96_007121 [Tulasnella sp. 330]|nr:hypothetical protein FRB96_007121 [Tulasnella sp. 330]